jgi:hypothetical protein
MSNKKISELDLVVSNASGDQFALVQNGETMKTTMSKIATFLGTIFTTVSAVTAQISAALVGYATEVYADTAANEAAAKAITDANEYTDTAIATRQLNYDLNNTATGPRTVTINALSGVAVFTSILGKKSNAYHDITNSLIEGAETKVECNLYYAGAGYPILMHYRTEAGKIRFHIGNVAVDGGAGTDTNANMEITFRIIEAG